MTGEDETYLEYLERVSREIEAHGGISWVPGREHVIPGEPYQMPPYLTLVEFLERAAGFNFKTEIPPVGLTIQSDLWIGIDNRQAEDFKEFLDRQSLVWEVIEQEIVQHKDTIYEVQFRLTHLPGGKLLTKLKAAELMPLAEFEDLLRPFGFSGHLADVVAPKQLEFNMPGPQIDEFRDMLKTNNIVFDELVADDIIEPEEEIRQFLVKQLPGRLILTKPSADDTAEVDAVGRDTCTCFNDFNVKLEEGGSNTVLEQAILMTKPVQVRAKVAVLRRHKGDRRKPIPVVATYCPFCGRKYPDYPSLFGGKKSG